MMSKVAFGVDRLIENLPAELRRGRVGMVTSDVATTSAGVVSRVALRDAGVNLDRLFGPEHGLSASKADGAKVADGVDPSTGLPVISLYGQNFRPPPDSIADLDAIIYDIADVGARFYTYIWTLSHVMESAAEAGKMLYVLDRPNPIGGDLNAVEGLILDEENLSSFIGRWNIPIRYSLTIGELARLWNAERRIGCNLHVIPCTGWTREMHWPATRLPFVATSPNLPSYESALFYPGTCLIEGTTLSEGRGTPAPFRMIGAPWVNADALVEALKHRHLPGVDISSIDFNPQGRKHAGEPCHGVLLKAIDAKSLRPVGLGLWLIAEFIRLHPREFQWLPYPTAADGKGLGHFDRLVGQMDVRSGLERHDDIAGSIQRWTTAGAWRNRVQPHLMY